MVGNGVGVEPVVVGGIDVDVDVVEVMYRVEERVADRFGHVVSFTHR